MPLSIQRIGIDQTETICGQEQLLRVLSQLNPELGRRLVINLIDSGYGNGKFLAPLYDQSPDLVNLARLRSGSKVYDQYDRRQGQPLKYYGQAHYLCEQSTQRRYKKKNEQDYYWVQQNSIHEQVADQEEHFEEYWPKSDRTVKVSILRWKDKLLKTKSGKSMKQQPVDIACIRLRDAQSGQAVFKNDLYLVISGQRRAEVATSQLRTYYLHRSDIEAYFRLAKQRLLLESFQTSQLQHLDNWLVVVQLATHLWWQASDQVQAQPNAWERYNPKYKQALARQQPPLDERPGPSLPPGQELRLSMAMTCKAMAALLATLDLSLFRPSKSKGGHGRPPGFRLKPKKRHPLRRKHPKGAS